MLGCKGLGNIDDGDIVPYVGMPQLNLIVR